MRLISPQFVSEAFARFWNGEYPPPFSPEGQGLQALKILTNLHLSLSGGASTFVSVSTSLLQALVKASKMKDPRIAVGMPCYSARFYNKDIR